MRPDSLTKTAKDFVLSLDLQEDRIFIFALIASIFLHLVAVILISFTQARLPAKPFKKIEVVYQAVLPFKETPQRIQELHTFKDKKAAAAPQILSKNEGDPQLFMKDLMKAPSQFKLSSKQPIKLGSMDTKRQVKIPMLESEKIMSPRYLNFKERLREKIQNRAYFYAQNTDFELGEVYLTFVLSSDGNLKEIKIIDEKSKADDALRNISLRSIKESSPFPAFPPDLKYSELPFSIIIEFKNGPK